ncbi:MAG: hypothetical protein L0220_26805 [Acidobacteria bacterium]|nr:hypothetical protein [Acidobacteriota bacterium]
MMKPSRLPRTGEPSGQQPHDLRHLVFAVPEDVTLCQPSRADRPPALRTKMTAHIEDSNISPPVDHDRIAMLRQAIRDGCYILASNRVATNLYCVESELFGNLVKSPGEITIRYIPVSDAGELLDRVAVLLRNYYEALDPESKRTSTSDYPGNSCAA